MNPCHRTLAGLIAGCLVSAAPAQAGTAQDPIIVTATRVAQTADETLASVTVITRAQIERSQAASLSELLQGMAGIETVSQGTGGNLTSLYLRGTNPGHVTVLVDGIRMGSVTTGTVAWEFLPLAQVERIEISRGPHSALYGSEAIGGVIQIFTRRGEGPFRHGASITGGRYNTGEVAVDLGGGSDRQWISARLAHNWTGGFDARQPTVEFGTPLDEDGNDNTSASLQLGHRFANGSEIEFNGLHAAGYTEYDGNYSNEDEFVQQAIGLTLRTSPLENWDLTTSAGRSLDKRDSFLSSNPGVHDKFNTERRTFSLQNDFFLTDDHVISAGYDFHDDRVDSTTVYNETSRKTQALFVQYRGETGRQSLLARLRPVDDEQFGSYTTGNIAWGYQLRENTRLTAAYGTAFKAPTFNDLYYPGFSNPNLQPEESDTVEVGVSAQAGAVDWDVRAFHTRIDNLIVFDISTSLPGNVNKAVIDGLEATISGNLLGWDTSAALTLLNPTDDATGNTLPRRAKRGLRIDVDRQFDKAGTGATLIAQSDRFDDSGNTVRVAGFGILNLRASWQLDRRLTLQGRVDNAFDKNYETVATYNTPGRSLFVTLRYESGT